MDVDAVVGRVSGYRCWSMASFFFMSTTACLILAMQGLVIVFIGRVPPHHCANVPAPLSTDNYTTSDRYNPQLSLPTDSTTGAPSSCLVYANLTINNFTEQCTAGWLYDVAAGESTIITQWDLVCEHDWLSDMTQVVYAVGAMIGDMVGAVIADYFGRKWIHISCYVITAVLGAVNAFSTSFNMFIISKFFVAISVAIGIGPAFTLVLEFFDASKRSFAGIMIEFPWIFSYFVTGALAYAIPDWRYLQLTYSLVCLIGLLNIVIPESPMWLEAQGRYLEAEDVLQKMAKYNGLKVDGTLLLSESERHELLDDCPTRRVWRSALGSISSQRSVKAAGREALWQLLTDPLLRKYLIIGSSLWFANELVFYFLILRSASIPGGLYFNFFLFGIIEIPAIIAAYFFVMRSRRVSTAATLAAAGLLQVAVAFVPHTDKSGMDLTWLVITLLMLSKFFISTCFSIIVLYTKEYFPTNLRTSGYGIQIIIGRLGTIVAPLLVYYARHHDWIINLGLGVASVGVAIATFLLPETRQWPLPQNLEDIHTFSRTLSATSMFWRTSAIEVPEQDSKSPNGIEVPEPDSKSPGVDIED